MDLSFYENNSEYMQFLMTCKLQALSYYSKLKSELKDELIECYFQMERGKCTNNLNIFFSNIHKQIEIIVNAAINEIITIEKLKNDLSEKSIKNNRNERTVLWKSVFYINQSSDTSKEYEKFKNDSKISNLSFTTKINIFYVYFIGGDSSDSGLRTKTLNYKITNSINDLRNYYNHGNYKGTDKQMENINNVLAENKDNLMWFYPNYLKILYNIYKAYLDNVEEKQLKI